MGQLKNKKVAVLGLGVEGLSNASYALKNGALVTVLEPRAKDAVAAQVKEKAQKLGLNVTFGASLDDLSLYDMIIVSQWIKPTIKGLVYARQKGVLVTSQIRLFLENCPAKVIGVTGTKGKGTTTALIYEMLKKQGLSIFIGGNIGIAPLDFLDQLTKDDWVVLELSSFQLQDLGRSSADAKAMAGKPHIAVVLMITSDHLQAFGESYQNSHEDLADYIGAKRNILKFQQPGDFAVINRDYPASLESDIHTNGQVFQASRERGVATQGCFVRDGKIVLQIARGLSHVADDARRKLSVKQSQARSLSENRHQQSSHNKNNLSSVFSSSASGQTPSFQQIEIINTKDIFLPGKHNLENVCAAVMVATLAGVSTKSIVSVLKTFKGLEHRLELVATVGGVRYYDDSFSTTPETAIAAIEAFEQPEILILGGSSKGSDFTELGRVIRDAKNIKAIIGIGAEWERIKKSIKYYVSSIKYIEGCKNMHEIVFKASEIADLGDVVLLSPACASFDMFKNYKERGDQFKREVQRLQWFHFA